MLRESKMSKDKRLEPLIEDNLTYDPETGMFKWLNVTNCNGSKKSGWFAGSFDNKGYFKIGVLGKDYSAHRLAWYLLKGSFPEKQIDHINGVRTDNRIVNLREVTNAQNQQNIKKARGTSFNKHSKKWEARISVNYKDLFLGFFDTEEEARQAYVKAKKKYHPFWIEKE